METVHLIDASPYLFRAFFALPSTIVDSSGRSVNAVYGFTGFLADYIEREQPTHLGIAFDESLTTSFRNQLYPDYKAQRELPPPELEAQQRTCREMARAIGAVVWSDREYEADDFVATAIHRFRSAAARFVIVSPDKDLTQLVSEAVEVFDWAKGIRYGPGEVRTKFGVAPGQIVDLLALAGDPVDNIPGVRGIGPKTAVALLDKFGSLDEIYRRLDEVPGLRLRGARSVATKLRESMDSAFLSRTLATTALDAPITEELGDLCWTGPRRDDLSALCDRLGFGTIRARVLSLASPTGEDFTRIN